MREVDLLDARLFIGEISHFIVNRRAHMIISHEGYLGWRNATVIVV